MSSEAAAQLIEQTDRALKGAEDETIDRIYRTLDASYKQLERELLKAYEQQSGNLSLLPNQRKILILEQVKNLLSLIDPKASKQLRKEFESLLSNASEQGRSLSESLVKAIANETLKSFVGVPIEALKFQAEDGVKRLARHGEEFASRASAVVEMGLIQGWGARKVASQLRAELGVTKGRAESIARTETASAQNSAIEANLKANNFELFQVFATSDEKACSTCSYRNQQVYKMGEPTPPYHPKCRCSITPVRQAWLEAGLIDVAWSQKYREDGLAELAEQGKQPNTGISPFEKAAGLTTAPKPIWKPGDKIQPTQTKPPHQKLIDRGREIAAELGDGSDIEQIRSWRSNLIKSGLSKAKANRLTDQTFVLEEAVDQWDKANAGRKSPPTLKETMTSFHQLTGGSVKNLQSVVLAGDRAYSSSKGTINVGSDPHEIVLFHEMAHQLEYSNLELNAAARAWRDSRATGKPATLRSITGDQNYKADEIAVPDKFVTPYVGKIYDSGSTEVISVGLEHFGSAGAIQHLLERDPEHFYLMVGMLDSLRPIAPRK